jgi:hypothetical protein
MVMMCNNLLVRLSLWLGLLLLLLSLFGRC